MNTEGLTPFHVIIKETDLHILAQSDLRPEAAHSVTHYRNQLENYICRNPQFLSSLSPLQPDITAVPIIKAMIKAAGVAGVGPMAAVAGAIAEFVGNDLLLKHTDEVMIENGGDIFLKRPVDCQVGIFAGKSPLSNKIGLQIKAQDMPIGICTSSATIGHSLSLGEADAVTVTAASTCLADAAATRLGNETKKGRPINEVLHIAEELTGLTGVVIIRGEEIGAWGDIELTEI